MNQKNIKVISVSRDGSKRDRFRTRSSQNRPYFPFLPIIVIQAAIFFFVHGAIAAPPSFNILDARERGTSNVGSAKSTLIPTFDQGVKKDVLELGYSIAKGAEISVWTKHFPPELGITTVNTIKTGIKVPDLNQPNQIQRFL